MPFKFYLTSMWEWVANTGLSLAILVCIAILIPRIGRLVVRWATIKMNEHEERRGEIADTEGYKGRLAILGALVYIAEAIAFFFVAIRILKDFGFSTTGAAVPATVVSAAVAFGAQKIIADFLAGFFIITERQYGVGDWVILQNKDAPVEGTVTAITLRSTTVRTINGQEAVVPNSVPLVAVNASSGWAKAQIDIPVPLTAGDNTEDLNALFDGCVNRTLARPEIARLVSDDPDAVSILPALDLIPPTSAGVPWSIQYRVLIRVEPGQQWTVERALRSAVMDEMWASYSRSTIEGLPGLTRPSGKSHHRHGDKHHDDGHGHDGAHASKASGSDSAGGSDNTQALDTTRRWAAALQHEEDEFEGRAPATDVPESTSSETTSAGDDTNAGSSGTASDSETVVFPSASGSASNSTSGSTAETRVFSAEDDTAAAERAAQASDHGVNPTDRGASADSSGATTSKTAEDTRTSLEKEAEDAQQNGLFRKISYERRIQRLFSIGGRCRASTTAIVLVLVILVILQGLTYDGGDRGSGILAPSSFQSHSDKKESDDKSESSAPTTPESNPHSENPTTERDSNSENGSNTPTTTPNRTQPTTTATNTENNRNQQNSTNGNQNSGNNGNNGSNSTNDNSDNGGANQQDTDTSNQGSGSGNSNSGNDNSGQMNLSHAQGDNNTASTMAP